MTDTKKTILVVDDDIDILEQTRAYLEAAGYNVVALESEADAKARFESDAPLPDLAVLDLMMENQDSGFILSHKIKRVKADLPVILVTAVTSQTGIHFGTNTKAQRTWIKADAFIQKPIRYEQLLKEIARLLHK